MISVFDIGGDAFGVGQQKRVMNWRLLATVLIAGALAVVVLWARSSDQSQIGMMEAPQETLAEIPNVQDLTFSPPTLPEPELLPKPESICDDCAHNSCAPQPPTPRYPTIHRPLEAFCETEFFLNAQGEPYDIIVECSEEAFVSTTRQAIAEMHWPTKDLNGEPCHRIGRTDYPIRYPIEYRLE